MIDTDKYEGHTPAPWDRLSEYCPVSSIDKQLIADAPLLLEEVQRLREENELLRQGIIDACSTASSGAKRPVADGSIKHYFPLYLREMIE